MLRSTRWLIAVLVTAATAIGYLDRQTLAVAIKAIQENIPLSDKDFGNLQSIFFFAYALMYMGGGRLMDALGTRRGFAADRGLVVAGLRRPRSGHRRA